jgi:hypothetical protein
MRSSTSSSERAGLGPAVTTAARAFALPLVAGALFLVVAWAGARLLPAPSALDLEGIVVDGQRARAGTIGDVDVLILGDSSALMGVDAVALGLALGGARVESLATIGYVGPAGFARLLEDFTARGRRARTVVLMMHGVSLALPESLFVHKGFEARVAGSGPAPRSPVRRFLDQLYARLVAPVLDLPLPGAFGQHYGRPDALADALREGHGSLVDPNRYAAKTERFSFVLSEAVASRLDTFRAAAPRLGVSDLRVVVAPLPASVVDDQTRSTHAAVAVAFARRAGGELVPLPPSRPDEDFATLTHLSAAGRARFTASLANALLGRGDR